MARTISKRRFLLLGLAAPLAAQNAKMPDRGPAIEATLVKDFVVAAHGSFEKVKQMFEAQPALINATWDWGGGDFETALGGASHMGRRDIAALLLEKGARMDIFAAAMMGKLDVVKAACAAFPGIHKSPGPHKIPLLMHAKKGGAEAEAVVKFLEGISA